MSNWNNTRKKVLVIGNGFDLAHGLKTQYSDFLKFVNDPGNYSDDRELVSVVDDNLFLHYLKNKGTSYWVDLETVLSSVTYRIKDFFDLGIELTDENAVDLLQHHLPDSAIGLLCDMGIAEPPDIIRDTLIIEPRFQSGDVINWNNIKDYLKEQLDGLKSALVIYLDRYLETVSDLKTETIGQIEDIRPDYVVSFNYTDTYSRYGIPREKVCHVHGEIKQNNIVLGYDDKDPRDLTLIYYKKYFQRIQNRTDIISQDAFCKNVLGINQRADTYIYGLSLDVTDNELIHVIYDYSETISILYRNQKSYEKLIINLIEILGKERVQDDIITGNIRFIEIEQ